jgi:hypothetical protein
VFNIPDSLTFRIAIVEAASCGLLVSTRVGGIPEVLPAQLADPDADRIVDALEIAIRGLNASPVDKWKMHGRVKGMYSSWERVAVRTEGVYEEVMDMIVEICPDPDSLRIGTIRSLEQEHKDYANDSFRRHIILTFEQIPEGSREGLAKAWKTPLD